MWWTKVSGFVLSAVGIAVIGGTLVFGLVFVGLGAMAYDAPTNPWTKQRFEQHAMFAVSCSIPAVAFLAGCGLALKGLRMLGFSVWTF